MPDIKSIADGADIIVNGYDGYDTSVYSFQGIVTDIFVWLHPFEL